MAGSFIVYVTPMDQPISTSDLDSEAFDEEDNIVVTEWKQLFEKISQFLSDCERHEEVANRGRAEYICEHLENTILTVRRLYTSVLDYFCDNPVCETTSYLIDQLSTLEEQLLRYHTGSQKWTYYQCQCTWIQNK